MPRASRLQFTREAQLFGTWNPVLQWLRSKGGYNISEPQIDVAHISMQINLITAVERLELRMQREVRSLLA